MLNQRTSNQDIERTDETERYSKAKLVNINVKKISNGRYKIESIIDNEKVVLTTRRIEKTYYNEGRTWAAEIIEGDKLYEAFSLKNLKGMISQESK